MYVVKAVKLKSSHLTDFEESVKIKFFSPHLTPYNIIASFDSNTIGRLYLEAGVLNNSLIQCQNDRNYQRTTVWTNPRTKPQAIRSNPKRLHWPYSQSGEQWCQFIGFERRTWCHALSVCVQHSVDKRSKPGSLVEIGFFSEKCDNMIGDPFRIVVLMLFTSRSFKLEFDLIFWYHWQV